mgnify:FL=1|jgi:hypothetical protein|tara:strand:- start:794 stop:1261 length:468 start_codon:yes stop_codon:yes gene_type:complete
MAAYTDTHGFNKGSAAHPAKGINRVGYIEVVLDFATITADRVTAGATALATGDSLQVLSLPANTLIMAVGATTITAEGAASTFDIGLTGGDVDGFIDGGNANAAGTTQSTGALLNGDNQTHYLAAADTIDMLIGVSGAVTDLAKIKVWAVIADCS